MIKQILVLLFLVIASQAKAFKQPRHEIVCVDSNDRQQALEQLDNVCREKYLGHVIAHKLVISESFFCKETQKKQFIARGFCLD